MIGEAPKGSPSLLSNKFDSIVYEFPRLRFHKQAFRTHVHFYVWDPWFPSRVSHTQPHLYPSLRFSVSTKRQLPLWLGLCTSCSKSDNTQIPSDAYSRDLSSNSFLTFSSIQPLRRSLSTHKEFEASQCSAFQDQIRFKAMLLSSAQLVLPLEPLISLSWIV